METVLVKFNVHSHEPTTGTSYEAGAVAEVPRAWATNEFEKKTIEMATQADLDAYNKRIADEEKAAKKAAADALKAEGKPKD